MRASLSVLLILIAAIACKAQDYDTIVNDGKASFYHDSFHGLETSNGETYDMDDFTAAHRTLPFNTLLLVTNRKNNKSVIVRVNDRGPFAKSRIIDLSKSAAKKIAMIPFGVVPVKISILRFLNRLPVSDSSLIENDVWDCYGQKRTITGTTVFVWKTDFWKHAFYMASSLSLDYKTDSLVIMINGNPGKRKYFLLATGFESRKKAIEFISKVKSDGFSNAGIFDSTHSGSSLHGGRQGK
jgi:hypothetical protein